ncbi:MAG: site-specific DNA-methyltransferase [Fimbriimonadales bacterium]|nr:site-specific DNA-methyltransferase [Fimbriimonadales bacterium]
MSPHANLEPFDHLRDRAFWERALSPAQGVKTLLQTLQSLKLIDWNMRQYPDEVVEASRVLGEYEPTNLWQIAPAADPVHPAVFPLELASQVIQLYSYKGDLVFDPFAGRGTVGRAALLLERYFFLTEKEPTYFEYARKVIAEGNLLSLERPPRFMTLEEFEHGD